MYQSCYFVVFTPCKMTVMPWENIHPNFSFKILQTQAPRWATSSSEDDQVNNCGLMQHFQSPAMTLGPSLRESYWSTGSEGHSFICKPNRPKVLIFPVMTFPCVMPSGTVIITWKIRCESKLERKTIKYSSACDGCFLFSPVSYFTGAYF